MVGVHAEVVHGPLIGIQGIVTAVFAKEARTRLALNVTMLGQSVLVDLAADNVVVNAPVSQEAAHRSRHAC